MDKKIEKLSSQERVTQCKEEIDKVLEKYGVVLSVQLQFKLADTPAGNFQLETE